MKNNLLVSWAVASSFVGMKCAILLNRSTTTMMASNPLDGGKLTMKSMDTLSHGPSGIGKGCNKLTCFLLRGFVGKLNKSSHTPPHYASSWANNRTSLGVLWCVLHHHGSQAAHNDILSKWCPLTSLRHIKLFLFVPQ